MGRKTTIPKKTKTKVAADYLENDLITIIKQQIQQSPTLDLNKINQIKAAIQDQSFKIDLPQLASKILHFENQLNYTSSKPKVKIKDPTPTL